MKIISFDVGIKNLAYCIFDVNNDKATTYTIIKWGILDLINKPVFHCGAKQKKKPYSVCGKTASFMDKDQQYFCKQHAKMSPFKIPVKELSDIALKRAKVTELKQHAEEYKISYESPILKADLLKRVKDYRDSHFLKQIVVEKADTGLVTMSINLTHMMNDLIKDISIDCVLIENQISKIASTMKTIQGMLTQYFVMRGVYDIHYISSYNKLKLYVSSKKNYTYKQRKELGVQCALKELNESQDSAWIALFQTHKKKDDLADSFLQGLWYINMKLRTT
jgi:hypothetical protein